MTNETTPASSLTDKEREAIAQMPYEEARDQLIQAVQALEAGGLNLDQSMRQPCFNVMVSWSPVSAANTAGTQDNLA